jgi:hypothetical protein
MSRRSVSARFRFVLVLVLVLVMVTRLVLLFSRPCLSVPACQPAMVVIDLLYYHSANLYYLFVKKKNHELVGNQSVYIIQLR